MLPSRQFVFARAQAARFPETARFVNDGTTREDRLPNYLNKADPQASTVWCCTPPTNMSQLQGDRLAQGGRRAILRITAPPRARLACGARPARRATSGGTATRRASTRARTRTSRTGWPPPRPCWSSRRRCAKGQSARPADAPRGARAPVAPLRARGKTPLASSERDVLAPLHDEWFCQVEQFVGLRRLWPADAAPHPDPGAPPSRLPCGSQVEQSLWSPPAMRSDRVKSATNKSLLSNDVRFEVLRDSCSPDLGEAQRLRSATLHCPPAPWPPLLALL